MLEVNGNISRYRMTQIYSLQQSNYYASSSASSSPRLSSLLRTLPPSFDVSLFLSMLEERCSSPQPGEEIHGKYGYSYTGIPSELVLITGIMRMLKGMNTEPLAKALGKEYLNPYLDTFSSLASFWGMTAKSFALASEKEELILSPSYGMKDGDNSKKAILSRILSLSSSSSWAELVRKFPEHRQGAVKGIRTGMERRIQVATILDLLKPFSLRLSDVLEEMPV